MANSFKRKLSANIGATLEAVGAYTVPASNVATVIGLSISNVSNAGVNVDAVVNNSTVNFYIVKTAPIPTGGALVAVGGDQKIVLEAGDSVQVSCDSGNVDAILSILETTL
jgi:hypothetical protein